MCSVVFLLSDTPAGAEPEAEERYGTRLRCHAEVPDAHIGGWTGKPGVDMDARPGGWARGDAPAGAGQSWAGEDCARRVGQGGHARRSASA